MVCDPEGQDLRGHMHPADPGELPADPVVGHLPDRAKYDCVGLLSRCQGVCAEPDPQMSDRLTPLHKPHACLRVHPLMDLFCLQHGHTLAGIEGRP